MEKLIIRRGMTKQAANEDGPSFEHQFGILSNAIIADKFPQLDRMKLAFQLIEKTEDNSDACGAVVYAVGKSIIFIPSFFRNNKLKTGDMFFIAQTQQFLPLSDPWLAWLKNKDLTDVAKEIPKEFSDGIIGPKGTTIREIADPLVKSASVFLRGLLHLEPDMQKSVTDASLLDTAIAMGKQASEALLDNMIKNQDFLNSTLAFYSGDALDTFAKQATALTEEPVSSVELILPLDKEASSLNKQELNALHRDGFFIRKQASDITPVVIRKKQLSGMFTKINGAGKHKALQTSGEIEDALIMKCIDLDAHVSKMQIDKDILPYQPEPAGEYALVSSGGAFTIPRGAMCLAGQSEDFSASFIDNVGFALKHSTVKQIPYRALLVFPTGEYARVYTELLADTNSDTWYSDKYTVTVSEDPALKDIIISSASVVVPKGTRVVMPGDHTSEGFRKDYADSEQYIRQENKAKRDAGKHLVGFVTVATLEPFIAEFCKKHYNRTSIYNNGSEYIITGEADLKETPQSFKEAALRLVTEYDLEPTIAKIMLKEAANGATYNNPKSTSYFISKKAYDDLQWNDANIGMSEVMNNPARVESREMPTIQEDPVQLQQAVMAAAQAGIKEVFDVTALKLLVKQTRFFDEIAEDIPLFMETLNSLCRKLFQFYWHTDKMEKKYGMIKIKALEESLKCTIDSLSELTIFFKLRTVDGTGVTGDSTGELMSGQML